MPLPSRPLAIDRKVAPSTADLQRNARQRSKRGGRPSWPPQQPRTPPRRCFPHARVCLARAHHQHRQCPPIKPALLGGSSCVLRASSSESCLSRKSLLDRGLCQATAPHNIKADARLKPRELARCSVDIAVKHADLEWLRCCATPLKHRSGLLARAMSGHAGGGRRQGL